MGQAVAQVELLVLQELLPIKLNMNTKYTCMITLNKTLQSLTILICCFISLACHSQVTASKEKPDSLKLTFKNNVGSQPLVLDKDYTNSFGETYSVHKFRYYISQIQIVDNSDMSVQLFKDNYFLVDAGDTSTHTITVPLSLKHISYFSFVLGVDSTSNVSGVQEGALDPANGMFWTWNSGYIMAKLQGKSPVAQAAGNAFSFDIGGFKTGENAARKMEFTIKAGGKNKAVHNIVISADVNKWFNGAHAIKIAEHPGCHEAGALAMQVADNYATMFSLVQSSR